MRFTNYLLKVKYDDVNMILFSTLSGSVIVLSNEVVRAIEENRFHSNLNILADLKKTGFLVDDGFDEKKWVVERFLNRFENPGTLDIVFAPSMDCNFGCPYCYESRSNIEPISQESFSRLKDFIKDQVVRLNVKKITINCYGGEPLMYPEYFIDLKKFIDNTFPDINQYWGIISNGSLIEKELERLHSEICLNRLQVTLHGAKRFHNKERPYSDGSASYSDVITGIKKAVDIGIKNIEIRINVDTENEGSIDELLDDLKKEGLSNLRNLSVYAYPITKMTESSEKYEVDCISSKKYFSEIGKWTQKIVENGFGGGDKRSYFKYLIAPMLCGAYSKGFFAIGPKGEINHCWEHINNQTFCVGNINSKSFFDAKKEKDWLEGGKQKILECAEKNCVLLPICGGGCVAQALHQNSTMSGKSCFRTISDTKKFVKLYVDHTYSIGTQKVTSYSS